MTFFANTTSVLASSTDGAATYKGEIAPNWDIAGNANGGYLLALAARAMAETVERPHPVSVTCHYLAPAKRGPVTVDTTVVRAGRRFATVQARVSADKPLAQLLGMFGDMSLADEPNLLATAVPPLPPVEDCVKIEAGEPGGFPPDILRNIDARIHPEDTGAYGEGASGKAQIRGWFRLPNDQPLDTYTLLLAVDAFAPTSFNTGLPVGWTPTLELTAHIRGLPEPGWLRCFFSTRFITGGFLEEDGEIWDSSNRLVAQSRQLSLVARP